MLSVSTGIRPSVRPSWRIAGGAISAALRGRNPARTRNGGDVSTRRQFLAQAAVGVTAKPARLIIDTHLEVWTHDPNFPFHHPENPSAQPAVDAPIENQVAQMRDFGLRYAVLINPR